MALANAAADDVGHGDHVFQRVRDDVAEQQVVAEAVADLRHFSGGRGGMKADGNSQLLETKTRASRNSARATACCAAVRVERKTPTKPNLPTARCASLTASTGSWSGNIANAFETFRIALAEII